MLKDLYRMGVFAKVVEEGTFTSAAEALNLSKSVVSAHVAKLEKNLGAQLLVRTTRKLALTAEGRRFYEKCRQMLDVAESAEAELETDLADTRGLVRVSCSVNFGLTVFTKLAADFHARYPDIRLDLVLDDNPLNLIEENIDLAIRTGEVSDPNLRMSRIGKMRLVLCAARKWPGCERVRVPADLASAPWISIAQLPDHERLRLRAPSGETVTMDFEAAVTTQSGITAKTLILEGAGVGVLPNYAILSELESGSIVRLLPDYTVVRRERPISLITPDRAHLPAKTRALIDFVKAEAKAYLPREG
jgi:DNA-binding transcriptional LysR family regulator